MVVWITVLNALGMFLLWGLHWSAATRLAFSVAAFVLNFGRRANEPACYFTTLPVGLGNLCHRWCRCIWPGDLHSSVSACHWSGLEGDSFRRLQEPDSGPMACWEVHEQGITISWTGKSYVLDECFFIQSTKISNSIRRKSRWMSTLPTAWSWLTSTKPSTCCMKVAACAVCCQWMSDASQCASKPSALHHVTLCNPNQPMFWINSPFAVPGNTLNGNPLQ
jgi:hypothetical protein